MEPYTRTPPKDLEDAGADHFRGLHRGDEGRTGFRGAWGFGVSAFVGFGVFQFGGLSGSGVYAFGV